MEEIIGKMLDNNRYEVTEIIGGGAFGTVVSAIDWKGNEVVALKELFFDNDELTKSMIREMYLQMEMAHPNIVGLQRVFVRHEKKCMYLVMEHLEDDLKSHRVKAKEKFEHPETIKLTMKRIIEGVHYLHSQGVIHRDLKPENILIDPVNDRLKIADLGCARSNIHLNNLTPKVTTLGYRAPEVIMGQQYTASIDMWSIGCVFSEVVTGAPLFRGSTERRVLREICSLFEIEDSEACTTTTEVDFPFPMHYEVLNNAGRDLLTKLLQPNPQRRISAEEAIKHEYLKN